MTARALSELQLSQAFLSVMELGCIYWEELIFFQEFYRSILMKSGYYLGIE